MSRLGELTQKVDAFFARVTERHGTDMQCSTGCSDCCHVRLTITAVEAAAIRAEVEGWPEARRQGLAATGPGETRTKLTTRGDGVAGPAGRGTPREGALEGVAGGSPGDGAPGEAGSRRIARCAALDPAGRCKIYEARPLVCRSHGVPIRMRHGGLPVVQACFRNFTHTQADPDCILDQTTLSATLLAIDAVDAVDARPAGRASVPTAPGPQPGGRVELAALLADLAAI